MIDTKDNLDKYVKEVKKHIENESDLQGAQDEMVSSLRDLLKWFESSFSKKDDKNLWFTDRNLVLEQKSILMS